jgi:iron complex outermembrane receptor protein
VVKDRETRQPIAGAVLILKETGRNATTDAQGQYKIEQLCQGTYVLECRIVGYKVIKTTVSLQHSAEEDINLNEDEVHLQDVEIVARRIQAP